MLMLHIVKENWFSMIDCPRCHEMELDEAFTCDFCGYTAPLSRVREERRLLAEELSEKVKTIQAELLERALHE